MTVMAKHTTLEALLPDSLRLVVRAKNVLSEIARDKGESDLMRGFARDGLKSLNNVIAQAVAENMSDGDLADPEPASVATGK